MRKVNSREVEEVLWRSPNGTFEGAGKQISEALGRKPESTDIRERHPFDVEIARIAPGATPYPYHMHSAQWEFYAVMSGEGIVRHEGGTTPIEVGDAFIFEPRQAHQITNTGKGDLIIFVVADNPIGESHYFPDSKKWAVGTPKYRLIRSDPLDYYDGEE